MLKEEILRFIDSDNDSFMDFWLDHYPADANQVLENSERTKYDSSIKQEYLDNGIYEEVYEVDINSFSFTLLKQHNTNEEIDKIIETIEIINNTLKDDLSLFRLKRLRIALFLSIGTVFFKYFNATTYNTVIRRMDQMMSLLITHLSNYNKLMNGFDSVITKEKPNEENITRLIYPLKFKLTKYNSLIKFMNLIYIKPEGFSDYKEKKSTSTNTDEVKREIIKSLINKEFDNAKKVVEVAVLNQRLKNAYIKEIEKVREKEEIENNEKRKYWA